MPSKRCKNFNTEDDGEPRRTTEADLAGVKRIQSVLRGPPSPSLVLRVSSTPALGRPALHETYGSRTGGPPLNSVLFLSKIVSFRLSDRLDVHPIALDAWKGRAYTLRIRGEITASTVARLHNAVMPGEGPASTSQDRHCKTWIPGLRPV